jgi:hypothetical protein
VDLEVDVIPAVDRADDEAIALVRGVPVIMVLHMQTPRCHKGVAVLLQHTAIRVCERVTAVVLQK